MKKERAEHAYYSHIHDEVTVYDAFPATIQKLDEDESLPEDTTAQDDQEDETEQSLVRIIADTETDFEDS